MCACQKENHTFHQIEWKTVWRHQISSMSCSAGVLIRYAVIPKHFNKNLENSDTLDAELAQRLSTFLREQALQLPSAWAY